jgi:hypothetical protein
MMTGIAGAFFTIGSLTALQQLEALLHSDTELAGARGAGRVCRSGSTGRVGFISRRCGSGAWPNQDTDQEKLNSHECFPVDCDARRLRRISPSWPWQDSSLPSSKADWPDFLVLVACLAQLILGIDSGKEIQISRNDVSFLSGIGFGG